MKNLFIGVLFSIVPIYSIAAWISIYNNKLIENQEDRILAYQKVFLVPNIDIRLLSWSNILLILIGGFFLVKAYRFHQSIMIKALAAFLLLCLGAILCYNLWSLL